MDFESLVTYLAGAGIIGVSGWVMRIQSKIHAVELKMTEHYMHKESGRKIFEVLEDMQKTMHNMDTNIKVLAAKQEGERTHGRQE